MTKLPARLRAKMEDIARRGAVHPPLVVFCEYCGKEYHADDVPASVFEGIARGMGCPAPDCNDEPPASQP